MLNEQLFKEEQCPFDHATFSHRKTGRVESFTDTAYEKTRDGTWHIYSYDLARDILKSKYTRQAGFNSDLAGQMPGMTKDPVLFQDGPGHREQRTQIARFFTPSATRENYQEMMEDFSDQIIRELILKGESKLDEMTMKLAVKVAAEVVGLTNSLLPGMAGRLSKFLRFNPGDAKDFSWKPGQVASLIQTNTTMLAFYMLDVKPAIVRRKKAGRDDVISHLVEQGYSDLEILVECITYGVAGMITTREFIQVATWHFLENPELRKIYLTGTTEERHELLEEILRLEPVVGNLFRRATKDLNMRVDGGSITIKQGELIELHIQQINIDETVVGQEALAICPGRPLEKQAQPPVMGFGFGPHRCPGAYIAIQETDIFLQRLLAIDGLELIGDPEVTYVDLIKGYEISNCLLSVN